MNHQLYNSSALIPLSTRDRELESFGKSLPTSQ